MLDKAKLFNGNGQEVVQAAYRVLSGLHHLPPEQQVQAVTAVFTAMVDILQVRPWELMEGLKRVLYQEESYTTTKALYAYITEEVLNASPRR